MVAFPSGLDVLTNPTAGDTLATTAVLHSTQHATVNDAIEALEAKVGVDGSGVTTSLDYLAKTALPKGVLGYAQVTAAQNGIGTTETDLTGLTVTVTAGTSRRIRVKGLIHIQQQTGGALVVARIKEGTTVLQEFLLAIDGTSSFFGTLLPEIILTPTAGSHTYKLTLHTSANTVNMTPDATRLSFLIVEDIGKA